MNQTLIDPEIFWKNISKALTDEGMSWTTLAELTGLSAQSMASARYLKSDIRTATLIRMCFALKRSPSEILKGACYSPEKKIESSSLIGLAERMEAAPAIALLLTCFSSLEQDEIMNSIKAMAGRKEE